ncbi:MAG: hypothetical protein U5Q03_00930 [Bacteroidota bacterium]|nr:hypothetical protein [Bacteroidota bacterium]
MTLLNKFLDFLYHHKSLNLLLAGLYYLLVVLPHEWFGKIIADAFNQMGRNVYQLLMLSFAVVFILIYLYFISRILLKRHEFISYLFLFVLIFLTAISYPLIIIHYVEAIHFLQYAVLALLLFPLLRNYYKVIFWGLLLGFADEAYQHFYLDPGSKYFDFNDVLLNGDRAVLGVISHCTVKLASRKIKRITFQEIPV